MTSQTNDTTPRRSRKKEIASFLHDCNARNDQKMLRLRSRGGWAWYGIYWACIEVMREATDYRIHPEAIDGVALSLGVRDVEFHEFLSFCAQLELFKHDSGGYYSESLVRRMERYEEKIEKCKKAAEKSVETRTQKRQILTLVPTEQTFNGRSTDAATDAEHPFNLNNRNRTITINRTGSGSGEVQEGGSELLVVEPRQLPAAYDDDPATFSAFRQEAEDALEPVTAPIAISSGFVSLRRRPMRKYPELWLTGVELATVTERLLEAGITIGDRPRVFAKASAHAKKQIAAGKEPSLMNAYGWLLGFCLTATLQEIDASNRAATSGEYLKQAKGRK